MQPVFLNLNYNGVDNLGPIVISLPLQDTRIFWTSTNITCSFPATKLREWLWYDAIRGHLIEKKDVLLDDSVLLISIND